MRIRKHLIGTITCLVGLFAFSGVASAEVTSLSIDGSFVTPSKQDKKVRGPASVFFQSNDTHAGALPCGPTAGTPACYAYPASVNDVITFPSDYKFTPGNLPRCNLASLQGKGTAAAKATCPQSVVGQGQNLNKTTTGQDLPGTITAFNGAPSGGRPSLYLHVDIQGVPTKPILNGVISGNVLTVQIPPVPGAVIEHFDVTLNKIVTKKKKNKKTGKVQKTYFFAAKCSKKIWTTTSLVTYENGKQLSDTTTQTCKQKKKKK